MEASYITRLRSRRFSSRLNHLTIFGLVIGWFLVLYFGFKYYFVIGANERVCQALLNLGFFILAISVVVPQVLSPVETAWTAAAKKVGKVVFYSILITVYFVLFVPIGLVMRRWGKNHPFYSWNDSASASALAGFEGWVSKERSREAATDAGPSRALSAFVQPLKILGYFMRGNQAIFLPALLFLMVFGLLMFFVQTSALAPFIYTLF